ncbi:MAG: glycosyltransferase, partial [bacterium]
MTDEISVITTSMNYGRYLEECIESVLGQRASFPFKINHIIMDGGSTDDTEQILKKYKDRIHYYVNSGEGQTPALNHAMKIIEEEFPQTNFIGWLNADDYYNPIWLQASLSVLRKEAKNVAMTCGRITQVGASPILQKKIDANERRENMTQVLPYVRINRMLQGNSIIQPTVLIRMSAFKELEKRYGFYFNEEYNFTQDLDLWHRFLANGFRIRRISARV